MRTRPKDVVEGAAETPPGAMFEFGLGPFHVVGMVWHYFILPQMKCIFCVPPPSVVLKL